MEKNRPITIAVVAILALVAVCCICSSGVALSFFDTAGGAWDWVARLFRRRPAEMTLAWALQNRVDGALKIGPDCDYTYAQGSAVGSGLESGETGFARDLSSEEVTALVFNYLQDLRLEVRAGGLSLPSGGQASSTQLEDERVSINLSETVQSSAGPNTRSLDGVVTGSRFQGSFSYDGSHSSVLNGQGVEEALSAAADLSCPVIWIEPTP